MTACVNKSFHVSVLVSSQDYGPPPYLGRDEIMGVWDLALVANKYPRFLPNPLQFVFENLSIGVHTPIKTSEAVISKMQYAAQSVDWPS